MWVILTIVAVVNIGHDLHLFLSLPRIAIILSGLIPAVQVAMACYFAVTSKKCETQLYTAVYIMSILDVVLLTTASFAANPETASCWLESMWKEAFQQKDDRLIRDTQNALSCCGFRSPIDKAWPFPSKQFGADACVKAFNRQKSCLPELLGNAQRSNRIFIVIAAISLGIKVCVDTKAY